MFEWANVLQGVPFRQPGLQEVLLEGLAMYLALVCQSWETTALRCTQKMA